MALVDEWIDKAEGDYQVAVALRRLRMLPQPDSVCYHYQQSAEKYLKAYLVSKGAAPPKIHALKELLRQCSLFDASLWRLLPDATILDPYSVEFRYPGDFATPDEATEAVRVVRRIRTHMRRELGL